jgi:hypothetical protein
MLPETVLMASQEVIERRQSERLRRAGPLISIVRRTVATGEVIQGLVSRTQGHIEAFFSEITEADKRGRASATPPRNRHRLARLIHEAEKAATTYDRDEAPTFSALSLVELNTTLELFDAWCGDPAWPQLVKSLRDPGEFTHALITLAAASFLSAAGNDVGLPEKSHNKRVPDLVIATTANHVVAIEVKVPRMLETRMKPVDADCAVDIVRKALRSAGTSQGGQLSPEQPGVLLLGGFHLSDNEMALIEQTAARLFQRGLHGHVAGVAVLSLGVHAESAVIQEGRLSLPPGARIGSGVFLGLARNPYYQGAVKIETTDLPWLRKLPGTDFELRPSLVGGRANHPGARRRPTDSWTE